MAQFFLILKKKFEDVFCATRTAKNSSNRHNSYNKSPNLAFFSFTKSPFNSLLTIKNLKTHITFPSYSNMPKTTMIEIQSLLGFRSHYWALGVKARAINSQNPTNYNISGSNISQGYSCKSAF
jgi:hypothetical protein